MTRRAVKYRSIASGVYDAVVVLERADGRIDIECHFPGTSSTLALRKVRLAAGPEEGACAWPA